MRCHPLLFVALAGCPKPSGIQAPSVAPSSNVYLRNAFDADPSGYVGRFLPAGLEDVDESNGMTMACSEHISWRYVDGGGVRMTEMLNVSTAASVRMGVPLLAQGRTSAGGSRVARVAYTLTGKMVSTIDDPAAFTACCKAQPDQCSDRMVGEFLQGTGAVYFEASREASLSAEGRDPSTLVGGDVAFSHGAAWQRAVEFPNPVYFAFKVTPTPYAQQAVRTCEGWVDAPPRVDDGLHVVGHSASSRTEQAARRRARADAQMQAGRATGLGAQALANDTHLAMQETDWCVEQTGAADRIRYTAHVLGFVSDAEQERIRSMPTAADLTAAGDASGVGPSSLGLIPGDAPAAPPPSASHMDSPVIGVPRSARNGRGGLRALLAEVGVQRFGSDQVAIIKAAAPRLRLSCAEVAQVLRALDFDSDRLEAAVALRGSVTDPENVASILPLFDFDSARARIRAAYGR